MGGTLKLPGGVKLNLTKKGVGASVNKKGFGIGLGPNGGKIKASVPGTGLSWNESIPLKKLKDAFFGKSVDKKDIGLEEEIKSNAKTICVICSKRIKGFKTKRAKKLFFDFWQVCAECRNEIFK